MQTIIAATDHQPHLTTRAALPFIRGFGTLIEQIHTLQSSTHEVLRANAASRSADVVRILKGQRVRLATGLSQVGRCCTLLPHPARFLALLRLRPLSSDTDPASVKTDLAGLTAQHLSLHAGFDVLAGHRTEEEAGELILTEVARSHAEMAWSLAVLQREETSGRENGSRAEESNWENEGGLLEFKPSLVRSRLLPAGA